MQFERSSLLSNTQKFAKLQTQCSRCAKCTLDAQFLASKRGTLSLQLALTVNLTILLIEQLFISSEAFAVAYEWPLLVEECPTSFASRAKCVPLSWALVGDRCQ